MGVTSVTLNRFSKKKLSVIFLSNTLFFELINNTENSIVKDKLSNSLGNFLKVGCRNALRFLV